MNLTDLAPELIHLICCFLDVQDVRQFRLTCKTLGAVAASHALSELVFFRYYGDFEMLRHFANHPEYSKHVRSLVYVCDALNVLKGQPLSFKEFASEKEQGDSTHWLRDSEGEENKKSTLLCLRPLLPQASEESLNEAYERYSQAYAQQSHFLAEELDLTLLRDIVPKFRNLKGVTVTSVDHSYQGKQRKDNLFVSIKQYLEPPSDHQTSSLLLPLMGLDTIQLRSLKLEGVRLCFLEQLQDPSRMDEMIELCRNLTTFEIDLDVGGEFDRFEDDARIPMAECRATVQRSGLRRLLGSMTHLEVLTIGFCPGRANFNYPATLDDIIPEGMYCQNLRQFTFGCIGATGQGIMDFVRRHLSTVTHLCLQKIRLIQSSWLGLLGELRNLAESLSLDDAWLSGTVHGRSEIEGQVEEGTLEWPLLGTLEFGVPPSAPSLPTRSRSSSRVVEILMG